MKIKCDFCGGMIEDTEPICPNCGAANEHMSRVTDGIPKTIEELRAFCEAKKLPLEQTYISRIIMPRKRPSR